MANKSIVIALIDDDADDHVITAEEFQKMISFNPLIGFRSGREFFKHIDAGKTVPDLIVLDVRLPGEDGISILRKIKAHPKTKNCIVTMASDMASRTSFMDALELGAIGFIPKPFNFVSLLGCLSAHPELNFRIGVLSDTTP